MATSSFNKQIAVSDKRQWDQFISDSQNQVSVEFEKIDYDKDGAVALAALDKLLEREKQKNRN